jgi:broad specificity phosphatase PhoE
VPCHESEARALSEWLAKLDAPDRVLSSPRQRTLDTARIAAPGYVPTIDERLHEWHEEEPEAELLRRAREMLAGSHDGVTWAFTHGGFIRAAVAALMIHADDARFASTFHDLRRSMHVWNGSITLFAHGPTGLELYAVNLCPSIDRMLGR